MNMKKIGHEVLFLATDTKNARKGEGSFIRLKDGRIMYAYTAYYEGDGDDFGVARLEARYSSDEGDSWTEARVLLEKDPEAQNYMSISLIRLSGGSLGMVYLRKEVMPDGGVICIPVFRSSVDEGETWGEQVVCVPEEGYYCVINDGVIVQRSGRILIPMAHYGIRFDAWKTGTALKSENMAGIVYFAASVDDGQTWELLPAVLRSPYEVSRFLEGLAEPGIYEQENGTLWSWSRTMYGYQYQSCSMDNGQTWSPVMPNFYFTSPDAPMRVKRIGKYTIAVFNPKPFSCLWTEIEDWKAPKRTPLACAVCEDDGNSFGIHGERASHGNFLKLAEHTFLIEDDESNSYCYPAIQEVKDGFLVAYYHSNGSTYCLNAGKIVKVLYSELEV